ncbi:alanine--tRNA ligase [Pseudodesulfovibrio piezophilus]|uniref:Alanine--tRNA ligase n=1 Tax=Pseudodesulfovibrio piezophilus (strain DSM 21447 / JCM 15486 / C1TLV30) TaxID=1322246 RepID=M1WMT9_PSEP2|nr:alanine--tRNA ligase [Pseudodesulfovibrio piezophilus]CCH49960.1 Alanyl-tRNA synthetase [Pseudodesulfovibrio piezophilus C1TLV30]
MKAAEIRQRYLEYFQRNGHTIVDSAPLTPKDDPTLMFTNAGMVQFKKLFLGQEKRDYIRATTSQKCLRVGGKHNDLENVGRTARHHTFFEMLGNFSFGDYFKEDAIRFCWGFLTEELKLDKERLYITIYKDDDEAGKLWQKVAGIPTERIFRLGEKDNFWSMGDTGPCGPCSEVHFDQGEHVGCGPDCGIGKCDCDRYLEIWNLVFMQYEQAEDGTRSDLPRPSIDTGMGLERIAAVCQGVASNYETDLFQSIIQFTADLAGVKYHQPGAEGEEIDTALQVIADHSRAIAFLIPDQVLPSNEGRGYILRRLIRRAYRFGKLMGLEGSFLWKTASKVVEDMGNHYTELAEVKDFMIEVVKGEEEGFAKTLDKGLEMLEEELANLKEKKINLVPGETTFKLYDTYGFPIDIVRDIAERYDMDVDEPSFDALMQEQKTRSKAAWKGSGEKDVASVFQTLLEQDVTSEFTGYETMADQSHIQFLTNESGTVVQTLPQGSKGWLFAASTPFYGESGGQTGDTGEIASSAGRATVEDSVKPSQKLTAHKITVIDGEMKTDDSVLLTVDRGQRLATMRNHTVTHLLHSALQKVLGEHAKQAGSLVGPDRLRFDFTHIKGLSDAEISEVETLVNQNILDAIPVDRQVMSIEDAQSKGATALFGEKYGETVSVIEVPGVSMEFCGGTHLENTGIAGAFVITSEAGVAAGIRRIEAATGGNATAYLNERRKAISQAGAMLKAQPADIPTKVKALQQQVKDMAKEMKSLQAKLASGAGRDMLSELEEINGIKVLAVALEAPNMGVMLEQMDALRSKLPSGIICLLAGHDDGKVSVALSVTKDLHDRFKAGDLIKSVAAEVGGGGGGRPDLARAGGTNVAGIPDAIAKIKKLIAG